MGDAFPSSSESMCERNTMTTNQHALTKDQVRLYHEQGWGWAVHADLGGGDGGGAADY